jgi:hypothetical protein
MINRLETVDVVLALFLPDRDLSVLADQLDLLRGGGLIIMGLGREYQVATRFR